MARSIITSRLQLALERLQPSDWGRFEKLASAFLSAEFDSLRTMAVPSGDGGRDSELLFTEREPNVFLQYSIAANWNAKILQTVERLKETHPGATVLVYVTNQKIGAAADGLRRKLRTEYGLSLDVRDRQWFIERVLGSAAGEKAAEELAQAIVDPYLARAGVQPRTPSELSSPEAVAALTYLGLQWQDDVREKGLTKLAFEALVRAALVGTDSEHRFTRDAVRNGVQRLLPGHSKSQVNSYVDAALKRLTKKAIRHWQKEDEFCLSFEETQRLIDFKTVTAVAESALVASIHSITHAVLTAQEVPVEHCEQVARVTRVTVDDILLNRSQSFAFAVQNGSLHAFAGDDFKDALLAVIARGPLPKVKNVDWFRVLQASVRDVIRSDDSVVQSYLRSLADTYTLLAFLRQTPDVQGAVEKMFTHGQIWLDTSILLPLFAESLNEDTPGRFIRMIDAAREAGLELRVTAGMIEEIERHMNRALACLRITQSEWIGRIPLLLERYVASGRSVNTFPEWLNNFRGDARPEDDIAEYLNETFGIEVQDLSTEKDTADPGLRHALQILWYDVHHERRQRNPSIIDEATVTRLVEHDVECYAGICQIRKQEKASPFGYSAWWLTLDKKAFELGHELAKSMKGKPPDSPVLSADFLVNYLAFGPVRRKVSKSRESQLPLLMDVGPMRFITPELMAEADSIREAMKDVPERIIRRRVRDILDRARRRLGRIALAGVVELVDESIAN